MTKAVILLSGGLDSTVVLALALARGCQCYTLSFNYGQRHIIELQAAKEIATYYQVSHQIITIDPFAFSHSALVSRKENPAHTSLLEIKQQNIPNTYVPARNTILLSYALGFCELYQAQEIHFGANLYDRYGYPDCRPAYLEAFQNVMNLATKQAVDGFPPQLVTPLENWDKEIIIKKGMELNAPLDLTISCYNPSEIKQACKQCNACMLREEGFQKALFASNNC